MATKILQSIVLENNNGVDIIPQGTYIMAESLPPSVDLSQKYENLKQLNPGMTFHGDHTNGDEFVDVQFRSGGNAKASSLIDSDVIPNEWRQAAQAEGYQPEEIIGFIQAAKLVPWEEAGLNDEPADEASICPACNGSGEGMHGGTRCQTCRGLGEIRESRAVKLKAIVENTRCLIVVADYSSIGGNKTYHGPFASGQEVKTWIRGSGIKPWACQTMTIDDPAEFIRDEGINRLVPPNETATDSDMY